MNVLALLEQRECILIHVKPRARKTEILGYDEEGDYFVVSVSAPPVDGKANEEIENYFSKLLKRDVKIKSGKSSKKKLLQL
jgi:uncharacterized protein (TIGR00251 family)